MKKILFILALIMPMIFMCSCSDDDNDGIVKKEQLIGTWLIVSEIEGYTKVEIVFKESNKFELTTYSELVTDNGGILHGKGTIRGRYTLKNDKISFDNRYTLLIKSLEGDILKGEIDFGDGIYSAIVKKQ